MLLLLLLLLEPLLLLLLLLMDLLLRLLLLPCRLFAVGRWEDYAGQGPILRRHVE